MKFCELMVGGRFEFRGRRYEKMNAEVGRDEERGGNVFHPSTEVVAEVPNADWRVKDAALVDGRLRITIARPAVGPAPGAHRVRAGRQALAVRSEQCGAQNEGARRRTGWRSSGRLGRSADRDLRPYGTV